MSRSHRSLLKLIQSLRTRVVTLETKMLDKELDVILEGMTAAEILIEMGFKNPEQFLRKEDELNWDMPAEFTPRYFIGQDARNRAATERLKKVSRKKWGVPAGFTPKYLAAQEELNRIASERVERIRRKEERLIRLRKKVARYCSACGAEKKE